MPWTAIEADALTIAVENAPTRPDADLVAMNAKFAIVKVGGKTRVLWLEDSQFYHGCKVPVFSTISDFRAFHNKQKKVIFSEKGKGHEVGLGEWWIDHPERRQYESIVDAPNAANDPNRMNLWTGFTCEPSQSDCSLYLEHLHENICSGNREHSEYLLNLMAYAVQQPGRPGEVAVVLRGKEGTGKGVLVKEFGRLFGSHFRHIVHAKHLTGHFNSHLQQCSVLYADELFFAGDRSHEFDPQGIDH